tara:strand:- start:336 stop:767 length:432 start_codon:yes stop_codon:yes gene_type:complete
MSKELAALRGVYSNYGVREVGGASGRQKTSGSDEEAIFEVFAGDLIEANYPIKLPKFYLVESIYVEVEEVFAASSTADLKVDGGAGLTTKIPLTTLGVATAAIAGLANVKGVGAEKDLTITINANGIASATGKARVLVKYKNM